MNWMTRDDFPSRPMRERPLAGVAVTPKCRTAYRRTGTPARQSFSSSKDRQSLRGGKRGRIKESKERRERGCKGRANDYETCALKSDDCVPGGSYGVSPRNEGSNCTQLGVREAVNDGYCTGPFSPAVHGYISGSQGNIGTRSQRRTGITCNSAYVPFLCPRRIMTGMCPLG